MVLFPIGSSRADMRRVIRFCSNYFLLGGDTCSLAIFSSMAASFTREYEFYRVGNEYYRLSKAGCYRPQWFYLIACSPALEIKTRGSMCGF